jgi:hypothetical protein
MLLIISLSLVAKIAFVCGGCDVGTSEVKNFNWTAVGITVSITFLKLTGFRTADCVYILFVIPLSNI